VSNRDKRARIVVIGAGPAGLFTAYYLKKNGYENVTVLEKLGRVGGLCRTITSGGRAFDLGANYVTPAYKHVLRLANEVGAKLYSEEPFVAMTVPKDDKQRVTYRTIFSALRVYPDTGKPVPMLTFLWALLRFVWIRFRLRSVIDRPTFENVHAYDNGSVCSG
jgi:phytoene dehydrogenase-like protein